MRTLVVYNTKKGLTQQVAQYLARRLHGTVLDSKFVTREDLAQCQLLVYGGRVRFGQVTGFTAFLRNYQAQFPRHTVVFGTGFDSLTDQERTRLITHLAKKMKRPALPFFYFQNVPEEKSVKPRILAYFKALKRRNDCPLIAEAARPLLTCVMEMS